MLVGTKKCGIGYWHQFFNLIILPYRQHIRGSSVSSATLKNVSVESSKDTASTLTVLVVSTPIKKIENNFR